MLVRFPLVTLALGLALASPIGAHHCTTYSTSNPEIDLGDEIGWYVDNDLCQFECTFSVWIYGENNGIPGLQRGDAAVDDTCHGLIEPDYPPLL